MAMTSFTLFSQLPLDRWATEAHQRSGAQYRALWRTEQESVGTYLAAETTKRAVQGLDELEAEQFRIMFRAIRSEPNVVMRVSAAKAFAFDARQEARARVDVSQATTDLMSDQLLEHSASLPSQDAIGRRPTTVAEWGDQVDLLKHQEVRTAGARRAADEALNGATRIFSELIGLGVPDSGGLAGVFIRESVGNISESVFRPVVAKWYESGRRPADLGSLAQPVVAKHFLVSSSWQADNRVGQERAGRLSEPRLRAQIESEVKDKMEVLRAAPPPGAIDVEAPHVAVKPGAPDPPRVPRVRLR